MQRHIDNQSTIAMLQPTFMYLKKRNGMSKTVAFIIAHDGYQSIEYRTPKKMIESVGIRVITVSDKIGTATAHDGSTTEVEVKLDQLKVENYDAIIFVGGPGALEHLDNSISHTIIQKAIEKNIILGAICISTRILAKADALIGKRATGWNGDDELPHIYTLNHVNYIHMDTVVDGNIITAVGPSAAQEFAQRIIESLH